MATGHCESPLVERKQMASYKTGDYVFAKIKGFCPWPARIKGTKEANGEYLFHVKFYGTADWSWVRESNLQLYNKRTRSRIKTKTKLFLRSIAEIEEDLEERRKEMHESVKDVASNTDNELQSCTP